MRNNHALRMVLGCALPLLLVFVLPLLGFKGDYGVFFLVVMIFVCHLGMMRHHGDGDHQNHGKGSDHEHPQH